MIGTWEVYGGVGEDGNEGKGSLGDTTQVLQDAIELASRTGSSGWGFSATAK